MATDLLLEQIEEAGPYGDSSQEGPDCRGCTQLRRSAHPAAAINSSSGTPNVLPPSFREFQFCIQCLGCLHLRTKDGERKEEYWFT